MLMMLSVIGIWATASSNFSSSRYFEPRALKRFSIWDCDIIEESKIPDVKVHLFGVTQISILEKFPKITSADSTGWIMTAAMGSIFYETGNLLISDWQLNDKKHVTHYITDEMKKKIERFGFTLEQLQKYPEIRCIYNAMFLDEQVKNIKYKPLMKMNKLF